MRVIAGIVAILALGAGIWLALGSREGGEPRIHGVAGPEGNAARSLIVIDAAEGSAGNIIHVYEPVDGASTNLDELESVTFRWSSVPTASAYTFMANNEFGDLIWRSHTRDTTLTLPSKAATTLIRGDRLKWLVQVPTRGASTDLHRLEIR